MKSISNRVLVFTLVLCALSVLASSQLGRMYGQEKVAQPAGIGEELPNRKEAEPPIIYGNQTPFGQLEETQADSTDSVLDVDAQRQATSQTVNRQNYDLLPSETPPPSDGILPSRSADPGTLELITPLQEDRPGNAAEVPAPIPNPASLPLVQPSPSIQPSLPAVRMTPVAELDVAPAGDCATCGLKTCTICCQPKCITKTILVPQYHTVWSSIFETRHRTEIKEEAYTVEQEVEHQVPQVIQETVMVAEPRIRTFQDSREEEYQVPVEEPYTVMVRKPRQRMVPVEREETYRYPVEQEYTEMVPQEKIVTETKYKTIVDKEIRQKKYTEEVKRERKRLVVDYVEDELTLEKRKPFKYKKKIQRQRFEYVYKNVTEKITVKVPEVTYVDARDTSPIKKATVVAKERTVPVDKLLYDEKQFRASEEKIEQVEQSKQVPQEYTVAVPYIVKAWENYTESVPYTEEVPISWKTRKQVSRDVVRKYTVKIPYIENIPRQYKIKVPKQVMKKGERYVPRQIPRTRYQMVKRDQGKWVTEVGTIPTYEIESDRCGCSTCCPKTRTVRKTVWQPNIVTSRIPYTVYETVKQKVPYEYPVLEHEYETRSRMEPVTRYRTEEREVTLQVFDIKPATETKTVTVRKFRQEPRRREITIQKFREEKRQRLVDIAQYKQKVSQTPLKIDFREAGAVKERVVEKYTDLGPDMVDEQVHDLVVPEIKMKDKVVEVVVRKPVKVTIPYEEEVELTEFETVNEIVKVQSPKPRWETYIETVPEIRTKIEYVDVEKRVPFVETKTVTEMVPEKRTRTIYKTDVRTVTELKPEVYFEDVKETFTRTVYKKKFRNVPVNRAEIYWVKVPKVIKKTIFKTVKRKVKRPALRRVPVRVPYQVEVRIPRRVCTMVPQTITIPVEECCEHCTWHLPGVAAATNAWLEYSRVEAAKMFWWVREQ